VCGDFLILICWVFPFIPFLVQGYTSARQHQSDRQGGKIVSITSIHNSWFVSTTIAQQQPKCGTFDQIVSSTHGRIGGDGDIVKRRKWLKHTAF